MKFRRFRNPYNRRRRIYSKEDILRMQLGNIFDSENDLLAQNNSIGIPTNIELEESPFTHWVEPFVDDLGEDDGGYWESYEPETQPIMNNTVPYNIKSYAENDSLLDDSITGEAANINNDDIMLQGYISKKQNPVLENIKEIPNKIQTKFDDQKKSIKQQVGNVKQNMSNWIEDKVEDIQKDVSEIEPIHTSEKEYYGQAGRFADGKAPSQFMQNNNDFSKIKDIKDEKLKADLINKIIQSDYIDKNDSNYTQKLEDITAVIPKENSQLHSQVKNSEYFKSKVAEALNSKDGKTSFDFSKSSNTGDIVKNNDKRANFLTLGKGDISTKQNEDGSISVIVSDNYDFSKINKDTYKTKDIKSILATFMKNKLADINNNAYRQQEKGKIQQYPIGFEIKYTPEEIAKILHILY